MEGTGLTSQEVVQSLKFKKRLSAGEWDVKNDKLYLVGLTALSDKSRAACRLGGCGKRTGYK